MKKEKSLFLVISSILYIGLLIVGCDQISTISESFSPKKKGVNTQPAAPIQKSAQAEDLNAPLPANVLAKVGSWTLTKEEFDQRLINLKEVVPEYDTQDMESKRLILEELIRQQLLVQDAERTGIAKKKEIVEAVEEFKRTLMVREQASKLVEGLEVTDEEAQKYYDENKEVFVERIEWKIREIAVFTKAGANEILVELLNGADFGEIAKTRSKSKSASKGGDLGFITEMPFPAMESALAPIDIGDISSAFKGPEGYYLIKLEERKGGEPLAFAKVKDELKAELTQLKQQQTILDYLQKLRQETLVKVNEDLLKEE